MTKAKKNSAIKIESDPLLPKGTDIPNETKVNVTKVEMANILTVQIQETLEKELAQAGLKLSNLITKQRELYIKLKDSLMERVSKLVPSGYTTEKYEYTAHRSNFKLSSFYDNQPLQDMYLKIQALFQKENTDEVYVIEMHCSKIEQKEHGMIVSKTIIRLFDFSREALNLNKEIDKAKLEVEEVQLRINKAKDTKYIRAKMDLGILASTRNGDKLVQGLNNIAQALISTEFKKNETKLLM